MTPEEINSQTEFNKRIVANYPSLMPERYFNFGCNAGWEPLVNHFCDKILHINEKYDLYIKVECIKEKFGILRIYTSIVPTCNDEILAISERIQNLCGYIEFASSFICENCGATKGVETKATESGWIKTFCPECFNKRNSRKPLPFNPPSESQKDLMTENEDTFQSAVEEILGKDQD